MKKLKGSLIKHGSWKDSRAEISTEFEADEIRIKLDQERVLTIKRDLVRGSDGIYAGVSPELNLRIVVRPVNRSAVELITEGGTSKDLGPRNLNGILIKRASGKASKSDESVEFEADEFRIALDHDRVLHISRIVRENDGIYIGFWSERSGRTDGVRIIVRPVNFAAVQLTAETGK